MATQRHKVPNHADHGAVVGILIEHGDHFHCVEALIDNGSTRSLLPYTAVAKLGLEGTLRRTRGIRVAGGGRVKAWRTGAKLKAQLASLENDEPNYFGPEIALDPWFVKLPRRRLRSPLAMPRPLAGRVDFLSKFKYSVAEDEMILEWDS